jgi:hypothetical protein
LEQFQALQIFEISIFCVVVLAVGYWVTVWESLLASIKRDLKDAAQI